MNDYYKNCAFPKPVNKKKKKKANGWKGKKDRFCKYCGKPYAERHELFGGSNRQLSIDKGWQIDVCTKHHGELQANITSWAKEENLRLRRLYQTKQEEEFMEASASANQAREIWISMIGKSYL